MGTDKYRVWVFRQDIFELRVDKTWRWEIRAIKTVRCISSQPFIILIKPVERYEIGRGIQNVNQDRQLQFSGLMPERIKARIVHWYQLARRISAAEAEIFPNFYPARPHFVG